MSQTSKHQLVVNKWKATLKNQALKENFLRNNRTLRQVLETAQAGSLQEAFTPSELSTPFFDHEDGMIIPCEEIFNDSKKQNIYHVAVKAVINGELMIKILQVLSRVFSKDQVESLINKQDGNGNTPLHVGIFVHYHSSQVMKSSKDFVGKLRALVWYLLSKGANLQIESNNSIEFGDKRTVIELLNFINAENTKNKLDIIDINHNLLPDISHDELDDFPEHFSFTVARIMAAMSKLSYNRLEKAQSMNELKELKNQYTYAINYERTPRYENGVLHAYLKRWGWKKVTVFEKDVRFFMAQRTSRNNKTIFVISFKGTDKGMDIAADLNGILPINKLDSYAGFYKYIESAKEQIYALLPADNKAMVYLTGHSLGGALAMTMANYLMKERGYPADKLAIYTIAAPPPGKRRLKNGLSKIKRGFEMVLEYDPVPLLSSGSGVHPLKLIFLKYDVLGQAAVGARMFGEEYMAVYARVIKPHVEKASIDHPLHDLFWSERRKYKDKLLSDALRNRNEGLTIYNKLTQSKKSLKEGKIHSGVNYILNLAAIHDKKSFADFEPSNAEYQRFVAGDLFHGYEKQVIDKWTCYYYLSSDFPIQLSFKKYTEALGQWFRRELATLSELHKLEGEAENKNCPVDKYESIISYFYMQKAKFTKSNKTQCKHLTKATKITPRLQAAIQSVMLKALFIDTLPEFSSIMQTLEQKLLQQVTSQIILTRSLSRRNHFETGNAQSNLQANYLCIMIEKSPNIEKIMNILFCDIVEILEGLGDVDYWDSLSFMKPQISYYKFRDQSAKPKDVPHPRTSFKASFSKELFRNATISIFAVKQPLAPTQNPVSISRIQFVHPVQFSLSKVDDVKIFENVFCEAEHLPWTGEYQIKLEQVGRPTRKFLLLFEDVDLLSEILVDSISHKLLSLPATRIKLFNKVFGAFITTNKEKKPFVMIEHDSLSVTGLFEEATDTSVKLYSFLPKGQENPQFTAFFLLNFLFDMNGKASHTRLCSDSPNNVHLVNVINQIPAIQDASRTDSDSPINFLYLLPYINFSHNVLTAFMRKSADKFKNILQFKCNFIENLLVRLKIHPARREIDHTWYDEVHQRYSNLKGKTSPPEIVCTMVYPFLRSEKNKFSTCSEMVKYKYFRNKQSPRKPRSSTKSLSKRNFKLLTDALADYHCVSLNGGVLSGTLAYFHEKFGLDVRKSAPSLISAPDAELKVKAAFESLNSSELKEQALRYCYRKYDRTAEPIIASLLEKGHDLKVLYLSGPIRTQQILQIITLNARTLEEIDILKCIFQKDDQGSEEKRDLPNLKIFFHHKDVKYFFTSNYPIETINPE